MSHETPTIAAHPRATGSREAQRVRKSGRLPAVIYGHKTDPVSVSFDEKELLGHLRHGAHVINVNVEGGKQETCLVKDLQFGYLGDNVIHIDFARVNLSEIVTVNVHLKFFGESTAARNPSAIVNHDMNELEINCKVSEIPDEIKVDLSELEDRPLTVGELELPEGITTSLDPTSPVAHISFVHKEEAEGEATEVEAAAAPEVITEAKPKEEDK